MIRLEGEERFAQGVDEVFGHLVDLPFMSRCVPDVEKVVASEPDRLQLKVRPGFSFIKGTLTIVMRILENDPANRVAKMVADGKGIGSSVKVETTISVLPNDDGAGSLLRWTGDVAELGGLLKAVSKGLIRGAAEKVVSDSWKAFRRELDKDCPVAQ